MGNKLIDLTGQKFGMLTVRERLGNDKYSNALWVCDCDCGYKGYVASSQHLRNGKIKSCSCLRNRLAGERAAERARKKRASEREAYKNSQVDYNIIGGKSKVIDRAKEIMIEDDINIESIGFEYLALAIEMYEPGDSVQEIYEKVAKKCYIETPQPTMRYALKGKGVRASDYIKDVKRRIIAECTRL